MSPRRRARSGESARRPRSATRVGKGEVGAANSIMPCYYSTVRRGAMSHQSQPPHVDYQALADLRYQVRRFLRTREVAARAAGVAPQQYVLLLQVKGVDGREPPTIPALAERV